MSDYDTAILLWSEPRPSCSATTPPASRLINVADPDWPRVAEEIEPMGRSELHAATSLLTQALAHAEGGGVAAVTRRAALAAMVPR